MDGNHRTYAQGGGSGGIWAGGGGQLPTAPAGPSMGRLCIDPITSHDWIYTTTKLPYLNDKTHLEFSLPAPADDSSTNCPPLASNASPPLALNGRSTFSARARLASGSPEAQLSSSAKPCVGGPSTPRCSEPGDPETIYPSPAHAGAR